METEPCLKQSVDLSVISRLLGFLLGRGWKTRLTCPCEEMEAALQYLADGACWLISPDNGRAFSSAQLSQSTIRKERGESGGGPRSIEGKEA